jgi:hypothetical protein
VRFVRSVAAILALSGALTGIASPAEAATAGAKSPVALAVAVEHAQLTNHWAHAWELLAPVQRAFIPKSLYVSCMSRVQSAKPTAIRVTSSRTARVTIPAPSPRRVVGRLVRLHVSYGSRAPSQDITVKAVRSSDRRWYWVIGTGSKRTFVRTNFCSR